MRDEGFVYRRLDGNTSIRARAPLLDEFNRDSHVFIMLLTTKAGALRRARSAALCIGFALLFATLGLEPAPPVPDAHAQVAWA